MEVEPDAPSQKVDVIWSSMDGITIVNKRAGMLSELDDMTELSPKYQGPMVIELAQSLIPSARLAHRIDCFTSGILLIACDEANLEYLSYPNWQEITRNKRYLAIILNPPWDKIRVDTPIVGRRDRIAKFAVTDFTVLERSGPFALVLCELIQSGRTHQIRKHLQSIGFPIVGDRVYRGFTSIARPGGQLLHAYQIELQPPLPRDRPRDRLVRSGTWVKVQAPIPADFRQYPFDWERWDKGANRVIKRWEYPMNWPR